MCGINGFNFKDEGLVRKMNRAITHRGPDGTDIFVDEKISLGHNRLRIIDLSDAAKQPMYSNDGNLTIVFNGEIYNYQELKDELKDFYQFKTHSDTEVILAAYEKWGKDSVKRFNGIFAFALWDKGKRELFLARDHAGVKPLYYYLQNGVFIFSSEIKAILEHPIPRILNKESFNHYMRVLYVPEPLTMFEGIYKFPQAHCGTFRDNTLKMEEYWSTSSLQRSKLSKRETQTSLRETIYAATKRQLVSDRSLGIYLSGGIDSSVVLDAASQVRSNIDTFSVGFDLTQEEERDKFNQDFLLARQTALHYGTTHHEVLLSTDDVVHYWEKAVWHQDEPISNPTAIAMMKLAHFTKDTATVVLGGDGGDELFGGYPRHRLSVISDYYRKLPRFMREALAYSPKLHKLNTPPGIERFALFMFQKDALLKRVIAPTFLTDQSYSFFKQKFFVDPTELQKDFTKVLMETDRTSWLVDEALMRSDKMAMSAAVEARVPLLDKEVIELAATIPTSYKVTPFGTKIILKDAFRGHIPDFLFNQPKRGWFSPGAKWLRHGPVKKMVHDVFLPEYYAPTAFLFNWQELQTILKDHEEKKEYNLTIIWAVVTFQMWARMYSVKM